jgi:hypothetical protein
VTAFQELLDSLRQASQAVAGTGDPADKARFEAQQAALARLQACLDAGLPAMDASQSRAAVAQVRTLLRSNGLNLKWTRLRARLARIGVPRAAPPAPRAARLDLVS